MTPQLPGDANGDEQVSDADYTIWADNYGASQASVGAGEILLSEATISAQAALAAPYEQKADSELPACNLTS